MCSKDVRFEPQNKYNKKYEAAFIGSSVDDYFLAPV